MVLVSAMPVGGFLGIFAGLIVIILLQWYYKK